MLPLLMAVSSIINPSSSYDHEFSLRSCRKVEVKKVCNLTVETTGHGSKFFKIYLREVNGDLELLNEDRLDAAGGKSISLKFDSQGVVNVLVILFNKEIPIAIDGATILVTPDKFQLGEQSELLFDSTPSPMGPPAEDEYSYDNP